MPPQSSKPQPSELPDAELKKANGRLGDTEERPDETKASQNIGATDQKLLDQLEILSKVRNGFF